MLGRTRSSASAGRTSRFRRHQGFSLDRLMLGICRLRPGLRSLRTSSSRTRRPGVLCLRRVRPIAPRPLGFDAYVILRIQLLPPHPTTSLAAAVSRLVGPAPQRGPPSIPSLVHAKGRRARPPGHGAADQLAKPRTWRRPGSRAWPGSRLTRVRSSSLLRVDAQDVDVDSCADLAGPRSVADPAPGDARRGGSSVLSASPMSTKAPNCRSEETRPCDSSPPSSPSINLALHHVAAFSWISPFRRSERMSRLRWRLISMTFSGRVELIRPAMFACFVPPVVAADLGLPPARRGRSRGRRRAPGGRPCCSW